MIYVEAAALSVAYVCLVLLAVETVKHFVRRFGERDIGIR